jgi:hypothetical protein
MVIVDSSDAWQKFMDKRVDIFANLVTGILLAMLALASWRLQQWWQRILTLRHRTQDALALRRERFDKLARRREDCLHQAEQIPVLHGEHDRLRLLREYRDWLKDNYLHRIAENRNIFFEDCMSLESLVENGRSGAVDSLLQRLPQLIRDTTLPSPDRDLSFPW